MEPKFKTIFEVADGVLGKKVKTAARNIIGKADCSHWGGCHK